jgi:hypothetical protein
MRSTLLTERQVLELYQRYAVVVASDGAPYLEFSRAMELIPTCQENDLAVLGIDGFIADRGERRLSPRGDVILDCSGIQAASWKEFRDKANGFAQEFLCEHKSEVDLVFEFVLWSEGEQMQADGTGIEVDTGEPDGKLRFSNKMIKLLPRRGWSIDEAVEAFRSGPAIGTTNDETVRPR